MNIHEKKINIKNELLHKELKKTGKNSFAKWEYFELGDFLPDIIELQHKHGVDDNISINRELATLRLTNIEDKDDFTETTIPYELAEMKSNGGAPSKVDIVQRVGATVSYYQRYLYKLGYGITDKDILDAVQGESNFDKINKLVQGRLKPVEIKGIIKELFHEEKKVNDLNSEEYELLYDRIAEEVI